MIDISKAEWVTVQPHPLVLKETVRVGALFFFDGMMKEIMVTSPILEGTFLDGDELNMIFSEYNAALWDSLRSITSPAFVIFRKETKNKEPVELGFHILGVDFFTHLQDKKHGFRLKVRMGNPD